MVRQFFEGLDSNKEAYRILQHRAAAHYPGFLCSYNDPGWSRINGTIRICTKEFPERYPGPERYPKGQRIQDLTGRVYNGPDHGHHSEPNGTKGGPIINQMALETDGDAGNLLTGISEFIRTSQ